ncbi:MAG: GNAT family N-acetyltransferase [Sphingobacteriales bacterium JAD_PAG50586_3]|nr:MAG: GNAT family N-acetyltransferase [Sphingobacteriales bacterium JAD_PAG50586_3]
MLYPPAHLETERLNMRPIVAEDAKAWQAFIDHDEAMRFMRTFFPPDMKHQALYWIGFGLNRYFEGRYGMMALIEKETGNFVGMCGLLAQVVDDLPEIEVGYHILPQYWGKGYAPEAAKFFINYAFENNLTDSIISVIDVGNIKSQRVAEKNGLFRDKQTVQMGDDVFVYRKFK